MVKVNMTMLMGKSGEPLLVVEVPEGPLVSCVRCRYLQSIQRRIRPLAFLQLPCRFGVLFNSALASAGGVGPLSVLLRRSTELASSFRRGSCREANAQVEH